MAVVLIQRIDQFVGLSTDTKPTDSPAGSTFYETDSGIEAVYDGSAWQDKPESTGWKLARGNYNFTDDGGAQGAFTVYTVTGDVNLIMFGACDVALTSGGAATIEVGVSGNTAFLIAQTTAANLVANEIWYDATPTATAEKFNFQNLNAVILNGQDVIQTIGTADLTAGDIDYYCLWRPLSADGLVVAA